ncbi:Ku protein [Streptomyces sp. NPDC059378]|uniref:non-homologous end joining protein Ku n=1 Tax=Streptomyces sp. NPDC059378 TaxID=3346815 RepID=UPI00367D3678
MPRTVWSGAISFGLVTVPVHVVTATEDHSVRFHQYHLEDMGRVRVRKYCELEDREVSAGEIGKGYQLTEERVVPVTDEDLRNLPLPTAKAIEITTFVPFKSINPISIGAGHYLQPDGQIAAKPYKLLREALGRSSKVAIVKYAWSGRERLGMLRVRDDVIVLHQLLWPDEIRATSIVDPPTGAADEDEIAGALVLINAMSRGDLEGEDLRDHYTQALEQIIETKRAHTAPPKISQPESEPGHVPDLMAALQESVSRAKATRGETDEVDVHDVARRKATKKQAAKRTASAKTTAKKITAKKTASKSTTRKPRRSA